MPAIPVTKKTFEREVLASELPVIVDFWAPWCGPCRAIAPLLEEIAAERSGELTIAKVNVDEEHELAALLSISSIPTIMLFRVGKPVAATVGARRKSELKKALGLSRPEDASSLRRLIGRLAGRR